MTTELHYENSLDDLIEFNRHFVDSSEPLRDQRRHARLSLLGMAALLAAVAVGLYLVDEAFTFLLVVAAPLVALSVGYAAVMPHLNRRELDRATRAMFRAGMHHEERVRLEDDGVVIRTGGSETRVRWMGIHRVEETPTQALIYLSLSNAIVVPKHAVDAAALEAFLTILRERLEAAREEARSPL